jgi:hypothetical protein
VRAVVDEIQNAYREYGSGAAWGKFVSLVMYDGLVTDAGVPVATWPPEGQESADPQGQDAEDAQAAEVPPPPSEKQQADDELFFLRMLKPFTRYSPLVEALRFGKPRVLIGVGEASHGELAPRAALALAERLDTLPTHFPGDHGGFMADPEGFAETLRKALAEAG